MNHSVYVLTLLLNQVKEEHLNPLLSQLNIVRDTMEYNRMLVLTRAGHQSLWYQRRLLARLVLNCILHWSQLCGVMRQSNSSRQFTELPILSQATYAVLGSFCPDTGTYSEDTSSQEEPQNLFDVVENDFRTNETSNLSTKWLTIWLTSEIFFVHSSFLDDSNWNPRLQKRYGLQYLLHLFYLV